MGDWTGTNNNYSIIFRSTNSYDGLVKTQETVTPEKAGVQNYLNSLDSRFHGNDDKGRNRTFYGTINYDEFVKIKNLKKRHADPETRKMTLLDSASNKIKGFRDPEIVDPEINSEPGLGLQIGAFYEIITYGIAMNIEQNVSTLTFLY